MSEAVPDLVRSLAAACLPKGRVLVAHGRNRGGEQVFLEQVMLWGTGLSGSLVC